MTRESAVRHPPRACFLKVHAWVVKKFDHATAAVFAAVEYRDRLNDADELWFRCTNDDLVQIIGGLFKKDKVAKGLNALVAAGWVEKDMKTEKDGQLYRTIISLRLMSSKINLWIEENLMKSEGSDLSTPGGAKNRPPGSEKSATKTKKLFLMKTTTRKKLLLFVSQMGQSMKASLPALRTQSNSWSQKQKG